MQPPSALGGPPSIAGCHNELGTGSGSEPAILARCQLTWPGTRPRAVRASGHQVNPGNATQRWKSHQQPAAADLNANAPCSRARRTSSSAPAARPSAPASSSSSRPQVSRSSRHLSAEHHAQRSGPETPLNPRTPSDAGQRMRADQDDLHAVRCAVGADARSVSGRLPEKKSACGAADPGMLSEDGGMG